jgi:hypothetical protein
MIGVYHESPFARIAVCQRACLLDEEKPKTIWDYIKDQLGIDWHSIERIKFAGGVVGKLTLIAVFAVIIAGVICYKAVNPNMGLGPLILAGGGLLTVVLLVVFAYIAIIRTTDRHPDLAAIEGMDLVTLKLALGTKTQGFMPNERPGPKPAVIDLPPTIEGRAE